MDAMIAAGERGYVTAAAVNLVMSAREDPATLAAMLGATLAVPDGQPLVWALRALGHPRATRVYGPDLMAALLRARRAQRARRSTSTAAARPRRCELLSRAPARALPRPGDRRRLLAALPRAHPRGGASASSPRSTAAARRSSGSAPGSPARSSGCTRMRPRLRAPLLVGRRRRVRLPRRPRPPGPAVDAAQRPGVDLPARARAAPAVASLRPLQPPLRGRVRAPVLAASVANLLAHADREAPP